MRSNSVALSLSDVEGESATGEIGNWIDVKATARALKAANASHVSGRRRSVDPTTCDREYSADEMEFMQAIDDYKRVSGRAFPTWSEVLEVVQSLGYKK